MSRRSGRTLEPSVCSDFANLAELSRAVGWPGQERLRDAPVCWSGPSFRGFAQSGSSRGHPPSGVPSCMGIGGALSAV